MGMAGNFDWKDGGLMSLESHWADCESDLRAAPSMAEHEIRFCKAIFTLAYKACAVDEAQKRLDELNIETDPRTDAALARINADLNRQEHDKSITEM